MIKYQTPHPRTQSHCSGISFVCLLVVSLVAASTVMSDFRVLALPMPGVFKAKPPRGARDCETQLHVALAVGAQLMPIGDVLAYLTRMNALASECWMQSIDKVSATGAAVGVRVRAPRCQWLDFSLRRCSACTDVGDGGNVRSRPALLGSLSSNGS